MVSGDKHYVNGQKVYEQVGNILTYYYKDGTLKARGRFEEGQMEGEWRFYRQSGQLWQVGSFVGSKKHGLWIRYDKADAVEYSERFNEGKMIKK